MLIKLKQHKKPLLAILFVVILILLPTSQVNAMCIAGFFPITDCITEGASYLVFIIFTVVGQGISVLVGLLQWVINIPVYPEGGIAVIDESWKILRNFANMFFIVALILMPFATIVDILPGAAKYNARALFGRFLLTALLINFSLVLGVLVIQGSQVLSNTFLTSIGDMSGRLGEALNPSLLIPKMSATTASEAIDNGVFGSLIALVFAVVLAITFLFSLLTAFIFTFIRIPILWALLVVSPIAWILNVFPSGQGMFKKWWSTFIGWNMFLPIFLFFLYFGLYFLQSQDDVMKAIADQVKNQELGEGVPFTFQVLFMYIMAGIFLIGGKMVAMKASMVSGTGVVGVAKWSRGVASRRLGLTAAGGAASQRLEQLKQEGLPGGFGQKLYGGQAGLERQTFGWAERFGVRGAADKQLAKDIAANKERFKNITDQDQLTALMSKGRKDERLAAAEILKDRKLLSEEGRKKTYELYQEVSPLGAKQFSRSLDFDKMSSGEREAWLGRVPDIETRQKIVSAMADKGDQYLTNTAGGAEQNLNNALGLFGLEGEQRDLLKKIEKHNFELATKAGLENQLLMRASRAIENTPEGLRIAMEDAISRMNPDALLEATKSLTTFAEKSPENNTLVMSALNQQKIEAMMAKGTQSQLDSWNKVAPGKFNAESVQGIKEAKAKELAEMTGKATGEAIARELNRGGGGGNTGGGGNPGGGTPPAGGGPGINPGNVVNLRNSNVATGIRPPQNTIEYLKTNLEFFDRSSRLKTAEELLSQGKINRQEYEAEKKKYEDAQDKISDLDLKGGLPNNFKNLKTRQDFERKLRELQP